MEKAPNETSESLETEENLENLENSEKFKKNIQISSDTDSIIDASGRDDIELPQNKEDRFAYIKKMSKIIGITAAGFVAIFSSIKAQQNFSSVSEQVDNSLSLIEEGCYDNEKANEDWSILEKMGLDIKDIKEKGFTVDLQKESDSGKYIIQIAQTHDREGVSKETKEEVIECQKGIEGVLGNFLENTGLKKVYVEGVDAFGEASLNAVRSIRDGVETLEDLKVKYSSLEGLVSNSDDLKNILDYGAHKVFNGLKTSINFDSNSDTEDDYSTELEKQFGSIDINKIMLTGGAYRMFMDGQLDIKALEDQKNINERGEAINKMFDVVRENNLLEVCVNGGKITKDIIEAQKEFIDVNNSFEDQIVDDFSESEDDTRVIMLGASHNLKDNVDGENNSDVGLIRLNY